MKQAPQSSQDNQPRSIRLHFFRHDEKEKILTPIPLCQGDYQVRLSEE